MKGRINSLQSLGTVDGPGVRFVVFMQGCAMRCAYCHNPDTWDIGGGYETEMEELFKRILRCRGYFGKNGGVTVSGGEPLLQPEFVAELFRLCKAENIHTALDTAGSVLTDKVREVLDLTDLVLLDYKMTNSCDYKKYTLCEKSKVDLFLNELKNRKKFVWIRHVIVKGVNDDEKNILRLKEMIDRLNKDFQFIEKTELLPFRKYCAAKYENMNIEFPFGKYEETDAETIKRLYKVIGGA